jgi:hypothetical protein
MTHSTKLQLFNSPLETGVRSVVLLHAATPRAYDLTHLTWLDHLVVHTGDVAGPPSLHPDIPQRAGELVVRRQIVEEGLRLMSRLHMVESRYTDRGIHYATREDASLFVQLIRSSYGRILKERATWLINYVTESDDEFLAELIREKVGRWTADFQGEIST